MNSLIIVESENDKYFIERLIEILALKNIEINEPVCNIEYECLNGLNEKKLKMTLKNIRFDKYYKIGIIIDADNEGIDKRIELINKCIKEIWPINFNIEKMNEFIKIEEEDIEIGCYIMNKDGYGELETVLKEITNKNSIFADCLESWKECLEKKGKIISEKDFTKFWINNYIRFDTCSKRERRQVNKKCSFNEALKKDIWDFNHKILDELKNFLIQLSVESEK